MRQLQLIHLYYYVCQCYDRQRCLHFQRQSNNYRPVFTDQEVITIYLFGILQRRFTTKDIYVFVQDYWQSWFPDLPSYQAYSYRLNQLHWHMEVIVNELMPVLSFEDCYHNVCLTDSMPIILSKRPYQAKVAPTVADKGYCPAKNLYFHGLRFHFLGLDRYQRIPMPEQMHGAARRFTAGSANDLTVLKTVLPRLFNRSNVGDKIYASAPLNEQLVNQQLEIITPIKRAKGQKTLDAADQILSSYVSSIRQPVEAFFNWFIETTQIQNASKVRSEKGLWMHCYGRLAAALFILAFNP